ncbi:hypothetical protein VNO77_04628 [Canavalia gladiata]|uniref:Uncharacterized protein n=1 Tax=Canavalia gladiata TaxID=3824 RepID=A0AAN9N1Z6_CANGL
MHCSSILVELQWITDFFYKSVKKQRAAIKWKVCRSNGCKKHNEAGSRFRVTYYGLKDEGCILLLHTQQALDCFRL